MSPPTGKVPNPTPEDVAPPEPAAASPDVLGDDPFALPGQQSAPRSDTDPSSPFGTAVGAGPVSDFANPVSVLDDDFESSSWGAGGKIALALVVGVFLAGVFYIMSIG